MDKTCVYIGFVKNEETSPGVYNEVITEVKYIGEKKTVRLKNEEMSSRVNANFNLSITLSIISNSYLVDNLQFVRYVNYLGANWNVQDAVPAYPRVELSLGGIYNGDTSGARREIPTDTRK